MSIQHLPTQDDYDYLYFFLEDDSSTASRQDDPNPHRIRRHVLTFASAWVEQCHQFQLIQGPKAGTQQARRRLSERTQICRGIAMLISDRIEEGIVQRGH